MASTTGPATNTSQTTNVMNKQQRSYFKPLLDVYGQTIGQNNNVYQGNRVAPFSDLQNSVFDFAKQGGFMTTPQQTGDYFGSTIKNPAEKNYAESTLPAVKEAFSGPGYWGSARAESEVKANKDLNDYLNQSWGKLNWDVLQGNKQGAIQQGQVGEMQQTQAQNQINADMQKFAEQNQITDPTNLAILFKLLGMPVTQTSTGTSSTTTPSWNTGDWMNVGTNAGLQALSAWKPNTGGVTGQARGGADPSYVASPDFELLSGQYGTFM